MFSALSMNTFLYNNANVKMIFTIKKKKYYYEQGKKQHLSKHYITLLIGTGTSTGCDNNEIKVWFLEFLYYYYYY
jgi:hypothetical protein